MIMMWKGWLELTVSLLIIQAVKVSSFPPLVKVGCHNHYSPTTTTWTLTVPSSQRSIRYASSPLFETKSQADPQKEENENEENASDLSIAGGYRLRRLKDLMWVRETLEDLTAAEFACSVESERNVSKKRAVDYEKLLGQLNRRIRDLGYDVEEKQESAIPNVAPPTGQGMGRLVYTEEQRALLLQRIVTTRSALVEIFQGHADGDTEVDTAMSKFTIQLPEISIPKEEDTSSPGPKLYVRDDGTVDWDGALQDQAALRKFGTAVWARINGLDPESMEEEDTSDNGEKKTIVASHGGHGSQKQVTAKIEETPQIKDAREKLTKLTAELSIMEVAHTKLLNSALREGQAVANINLASVEPAQRSRIRQSAAELEKMKETVSYQGLLYDLERIYTYLAGELGNPATKGYISLQDRLNVAEFGLLESQIESFNNQLDKGDLLDTDVLAVVTEQFADFKRRLGIDYTITGVTFDADAIKRLLRDLLEKTRKGLAFYAKGVRLFWNDIMFCLSLINRAAQGYTLKPREVRTIRRTFKDVLTFIPFIIILIIPLTPVGHVLVFGAIQRFFPDFFPSCFTEQRQNLLQLYETAEYSEFTIDENWKEKSARISEAFAYLIANAARSLYTKGVSMIRGEGSASEESGADGSITDQKP